jgi:segregation and condensation protein A
MNQKFTIKQGRFEGPYTTLLQMIEDKKLHISEISLSKIADDYIDYVKSLDNIDTFDLSQFVVVASTLMLIKAKSLMPQMNYTEEEKQEVDNLEKKLELLKVVREAENNIKSIWSKTPMLKRQRVKILEKRFKNPDNFTLQNIHSVLILTLAKMPNFEKLRRVAVRQAVKLEDVIEKMINRIGKEFSSLKQFAQSLSLSDDKDGAEPLEKKEQIKNNIVVSFLAILELLRQNLIKVEQHDNDIKIESVDSTLKKL